MKKKSLCNNCGVEFEFYTSDSSGKFCSKDCYLEARWGSQENKATITCSVCGKERTYYKSAIEIGCGRTCGSVECRSEVLRDQKTVTCESCGKEFTTFSASHRKYCSRKCYGSAIRIADGTHGNKSGSWRKWQRREWLDAECCMCGSSEVLELDHIVPVACGGMSVRENAQTLCHKCHAHKRITSDREMLAKIGKRDY